MSQFDNTEVRVFHSGEPGRFAMEQLADGPIHIEVGRNVSDDRLLINLPKLDRYGVTFEQLQQARDGGGYAE